VRRFSSQISFADLQPLEKATSVLRVRQPEKTGENLVKGNFSGVDLCACGMCADYSRWKLNKS